MNGASTPMTKKIIPAIALISVLLVVLVPVYVFAAIVPCSMTIETDGTVTDPCTFDKFIDLINEVIDFLMFKFAVPLAAISFAIAGVMILTAGDNSSQVTQAKEIFWNVLIGLIVALSAWLVVNAILIGLGAKELGSFE